MVKAPPRTGRFRNRSCSLVRSWTGVSDAIKFFSCGISYKNGSATINDGTGLVVRLCTPSTVGSVCSFACRNTRHARRGCVASGRFSVSRDGD
jgi:hypothetical protein